MTPNADLARLERALERLPTGELGTWSDAELLALIEGSERVLKLPRPEAVAVIARMGADALAVLAAVALATLEARRLPAH